MTPSLSTFVFELANFVVLALVLTKVFFRPVRQAVEARLADEEARLAAIEAKRAEVEARSVEMEEARLKGVREGERLRREAEQAAEREAEAIVAKGRARVEAERLKLRSEKTRLEKKEVEEIADTAAAVAAGAVERLLRQIDGPELERALIESACRQLELQAGDRLAPVLVESAVALDQETTDKIRAAAGSAGAGAEFSVASELLGGLRVSTARGRIDASLLGLSSFTRSELATGLQKLADASGEDG